MEEKMVLYRGIAVENNKVRETISQIQENGLRGNEGYMKFVGCDLRSSVEKLFYKQNLTPKDTREGFREFPVIPFADELGAYYYALIHNYNKGKTPLIIKIEVDIRKKYIYIDGRDFLYSVFQNWDRKNLVKKYGIKKAYKLVSSTLEKIYGIKILKYFRKSAEEQNQLYRIAMCDLATDDIEVVKGHFKNKIVIGGRYGVVFRSAFFVEAPITSKEIKDVFIPDVNNYVFNPEIRLYEWL